MKNSVDVSVIIVNYKVKDKLFHCLESIYNSKPKVKFEIIVVDNDETKIIGKELKENFSKVKYIKSSKNLGFGGGNNLGSENSTGKYLFFLNPDTIVLKQSLDILFNFFEKNNKIGIASPLILNKDHDVFSLQGYKELTPKSAIFSFSFLRKIFPQKTIFDNVSKEDWNKQPIKEVDCIFGAALMIRSEVFNKLGGFDEKFFLYFEENDLSKRVRNLGYKAYINSNSKIIHEVGQSTKKVDNVSKFFSRSRFYYLKKHFGVINALLTELFLKINMISVLVFAAVILGVFLRMFNISNGMQFIGDQGWFYLSARDMLIQGTVPLVGITSSHTWLHQGPLWTYLLSVFLFVFNFNPLAGAYLTTLFGIFTIILIYKISSDLFSKEVGIIASFLYATSPLIIFFDRAPLDPSIIPLFSLLYFYAIVKWVKGNIIFFTVLIFLIAILYNLELATFILFFPLLIIFLYGLWKNKNWIIKLKNTRTLIYSLLAFLIPMAPIIIYDFSNGFKQTIIFFGWTIYKPFSFLFLSDHRNSMETINNVFNFFVINVQRLIFELNLYVALLILVFSIIFLISGLIRKREASSIILFLLIFISFGGIFVNQTPSDAYLPIIFPLIIVLISIFLRFLFSFNKLLIIVVFLIVIFNVQSALNDDLANDLDKRVVVADKIIALTKNTEYNLIGKGVGSQFDSFTMNYEYLLWLKGNPPSHKNQKTKILIRETNGQIIVKKYD